MSEQEAISAAFANGWTISEESAVDVTFNPRVDGLARPRTSPGTFHERTDLFVGSEMSPSEDYRTRPEYHAYYYSQVPRDPRLPVPLKPRHATAADGSKAPHKSPSLTHQPYQPVTPEFLPKNLLNSPEVPSMALPKSAMQSVAGFSLMGGVVEPSSSSAEAAERHSQPLLQLGLSDGRFLQGAAVPQQPPTQSHPLVGQLNPMVAVQQPHQASVAASAPHATAPVVTVGQRPANTLMPLSVTAGTAPLVQPAGNAMSFNPYAVGPQRPMVAAVATKPVPTTLHPYPQLDHSQAGGSRARNVMSHQPFGQGSLNPASGLGVHGHHVAQQPAGTLHAAMHGGNSSSTTTAGGRGMHGHSAAAGGRSSGTAAFQKPKSELLTEFLENPHRPWQLGDIVGHIVDFSQDQDGSRLIQRFMEDGNTHNAMQIFNEVKPVLRELVTDVFGNYVVQKLLESGIQEVRDEVVESMRGDVLNLSLQTYGCRVVQKAFDHVDFHQQLTLAAELDGAVPSCVLNQNANHVIQKCIETMPDNCQFIINSFLGRVLELSCHAYGCRVLQRVFEKCRNQSHLKELLDEVLANTAALVADQYGNYVVQHALINSPRPIQAEIIRILSPRIKELACSKFASNVAEKIFEFAAPDELANLFRLLMEVDANGSSALVCMMQDQFANYVVQRLIKVASPQQRQEIVEHITPRIPAIRRFTYGKHILARLEKMGLLPPSAGGGNSFGADGVAGGGYGGRGGAGGVFAGGGHHHHHAHLHAQQNQFASQQHQDANGQPHAQNHHHHHHHALQFLQQQQQQRAGAPLAGDSRSSGGFGGQQVQNHGARGGRGRGGWSNASGSSGPSRNPRSFPNN